jgi:ABC-type dipeptide/oligopeptide/nickel transport system permease component
VRGGTAGLVIVTVNLIVDLIVGLIDPRIRVAA